MIVGEIPAQTTKPINGLPKSNHLTRWRHSSLVAATTVQHNSLRYNRMTAVDLSVGDPRRVGIQQ